MSIRIIFILYLQFFFIAAVFGQDLVKGRVLDEVGNPIPSASVYWLKTQTGTTTDASGHYELSRHSTATKLIFSYIGYQPDTLAVPVSGVVPDVYLQASLTLREVEIAGKQQTTQISSISTIKVETVTSAELKKAACCNLAESFETNASVDVVYSDAVSGARKIQMLGLDGQYTQMLFEGIPAIRGLGIAYGMSYIPGTWLESIQITKGTGSVLYGYESMAGQINLEYFKPNLPERLFVNGYLNNNLRAELNVHGKTRINEKWNMLTFLHGSNTSSPSDHNDDGFYDMPMGSQASLFNRWWRSGEKTETQLGVRLMYDNKTGGQIGYRAEGNPSPPAFYGITVKTNQAEVFAKNGFLFPSHPYRSVGIVSSVKYHDQTSLFGTRQYSGTQQTGFLNVIYQDMIRSTVHKYKLGISYLADDYQEMFEDSVFTRLESVPGMFAEYSYGDSSGVSMVAGVRGDYHNLYGFRANPRLHLKYSPTEQTTLRLSGGSGMRTPNPIAENPSVFASSRRLLIKESPKQERSWNVGGSGTVKGFILAKEVSLNLDIFHTRFENQWIVDLDQSPQKVIMYNLKGESYANTAQVEMGFEITKTLDARVAYKWQDVWVTYSGILRQKPMVPEHRAFLNLAWASRNRKWKADYTTKWTGIARLPKTSQNPSEYRHGAKSESFMIHNAQVTRIFKHFEIYLGVENALNYIQHHAIIAYDDPFGPYFDASLIWGPLNGRMIYGGFRYSLK